MSYTKVQNDLLERRDLSPAEKLILIYLHGRKRRGQPWEVNAEYVWTELAMAPSTAKSALAGLKAKGWLTDNRKAIQGPDGRWRRGKSAVVESRRSDVVAPDVSPGRTESGKPTSVIPPVMNNQTTSTASASEAGRDRGPVGPTPTPTQPTPTETTPSASSPPPRRSSSSSSFTPPGESSSTYNQDKARSPETNPYHPNYRPTIYPCECPCQHCTGRDPHSYHHCPIRERESVSAPPF